MEQSKDSFAYSIYCFCTLISQVYKQEILTNILCFSVLEGMTLGIEDDSAGVWLNAVATSLHKFVLAFTIGVELISNKVQLCLQVARFIKYPQVSMLVYHIYTLIFGFAGAVGTLFGINLEKLIRNIIAIKIKVFCCRRLLATQKILISFSKYFKVLKAGRK